MDPKIPWNSNYIWVGISYCQAWGCKAKTKGRIGRENQKRKRNGDYKRETHLIRRNVIVQSSPWGCKNRIYSLNKQLLRSKSCSVLSALENLRRELLCFDRRDLTENLSPSVCQLCDTVKSCSLPMLPSSMAPTSRHHWRANERR